MAFQQEFLPKVKDATPEQQWGYTLLEFIKGNWPYLLGIVLLLAIFFYARYRQRKRWEKRRQD